MRQLASSREAVAKLRAASGGRESLIAGDGVNRHRPRFQTAAAASWWRWSLVRLWVAISSRHSVRTAILPLRWKRLNQPVVFGVREHGLDHLDPLAVELFAVL